MKYSYNDNNVDSWKFFSLYSDVHEQVLRGLNISEFLSGWSLGNYWKCSICIDIWTSENALVISYFIFDNNNWNNFSVTFLIGGVITSLDWRIF